MVVINYILYLSVNELEGFGFSRLQIDKKTTEGAYPSLFAFDPDQPHRKEVKLIPYTGLPEATRKEKGLPPMETLLSEARQRALFRIAGIDADAFNHYLANSLIKPTRNATRNQLAKEKAEQFKVLFTIAECTNTIARAYGFESKKHLLNSSVAALQLMAKQRGWTSWSVNSIAGLNKKLKPLQQLKKGKITRQQAYESLISKRINNDFAETLSPDNKALLVSLMADGNAKLNIQQVHAIYTRKANEMIAAGLWTETFTNPNSKKLGQPRCLVSDGTVRNFLYQPDIRPLWYEPRHGLQAYRNLFDPQILRTRPSFANALWVIDGTPLHRYFQHLKEGAYYRWNIFTVIDAATDCVLGWWLSDREDTESVLGALRTACMVTGYLPYQVLYDNGAAITSLRAQRAIELISTVHFAASVGNARSKVVENWFHWFNQNVQKYRTGFTHNPFAMRIDNRPNREAIALAIREKRLPLSTDAVRELAMDLSIANQIPREFLGNKSAIEKYRASVAATQHLQRAFSPQIDIEAFYTEPGTERKVKTLHEGKPAVVREWVPQLYPYSSRGIELTINNQTYAYHLPNQPAWEAGTIGQKYSVKYEPNPKRWANGQQPDQLLLYLQGTPVQWQGMHVALVPNERLPMAIADYQPGTRAELDRRLDTKREVRNIHRQRFKQMVDHTKANGTYVDVVTANAYDKDVLQNATAHVLNHAVQADDFKITNAPLPSEPIDFIDRLDVGMGEKQNPPSVELDGPVDE